MSYWLDAVKHTPSPNFDARPTDCSIDLLVIHNISLPPGVFEGDDVEAFFLNQLHHSKHPFFEEIRELKVSSHLFIRRDGSAQQFVDLDNRAWHAGQSTWQGKERCNDFSIGIELEGTDDQTFTDAQYKTLIQLTLQIQQQYPDITNDRIVGHSDIAPDRKTDPGPHFDWSRYRQGLSQ
ncbi:MAG: 1,6-anhydro-N-acetylmuramyl-L-alanine amidase AmpD [Sedimenticolaceae bacterium]|jgi:AmpD protein